MFDYDINLKNKTTNKETVKFQDNPG
uniref:Uncharacterized protein n=1 Tax=Rhizophora mucronata TaxID=61149 RepID=A0A2P2P9Z8_RHIMU